MREVLVLALAYGYVKIAEASMPCYCRHCGPALLYPTTPYAPCTISSQYTQQTSRTNTSVSAKYTDHAFARVGHINEIVVNSLSKCSFITSCYCQNISCIERRHMRQILFIVLALPDIHTVWMFLVLQMFCPEISHVHHGVQLMCFTKRYVFY